MTQHACEWCDVTFTDLSDLNVHLESHKGEDYDNSDIVQIDGNVSVLSEKSNPLSQPSTQRKQRGKKDVLKDPKDVEIDFLKRELNIVREHETEVKDLKRKNQVLADTVAIFENNKQAAIPTSTPQTVLNPELEPVTSPTSTKSLSGSINSLDEFASDLSMECCSPPANNHPEQNQTHLNCRDLTTQ